jgi:exopolysaccharide production protein ExoQ
LLSWLLAAIAPRFAVASHQITWRLQGIMQHEFRLGLLASCVLIIIAIWRRNLSGESRYLPWKYRIIGLVAFVTLVATKTRSLLAYTLLCLVIISVTKASIIKRMIIICFAVTAVFVFEYYGDEIISLFSRGKMDYTLTGRTLIWETTLRVANSAFLAGHGFASFTDPYFDRMWHIFYRPSHSHNGWLQTYFETGIIGVVLMTIFRVIAIALAWRNQKKLLYPSYALFLLLLATMYDMTGLAMGGKISMIYGLVLVFLFQETLTVHMVNNSTNKISQQPK